MIRVDPNSRRILPNTTMSYSWFNALQDEVCLPIEKMLHTLLPTTDQLSTSINRVMEGQQIDLPEVTDYSGAAVPISSLSIGEGEVCSFDLHLDSDLKAPLELSLDSIPNHIKEFYMLSTPQIFGATYTPYSLDLNTSSANFHNLSTILSSEDLLEKISGFNTPESNDFSRSGYKVMRMPTHPSYSPEYMVSIIRMVQTLSYLSDPSPVISYCFGKTKNGTMNVNLYPGPIDLQAYRQWISKLSSLVKKHDSDKNENINVSTLFFYSMLRAIPPVTLASDPNGQIYYFFNKMVYGDLLKVRMSVSNVSRVFA